jgi:hypothetical protein
MPILLFLTIIHTALSYIHSTFTIRRGPSSCILIASLGCPAENQTRADALPTELRRTLSQLRRTLTELRRILNWATPHPTEELFLTVKERFWRWRQCLDTFIMIFTSWKQFSIIDIVDGLAKVVIIGILRKRQLKKDRWEEREGRKRRIESDKMVGDIQNAIWSSWYSSYSHFYCCKMSLIWGELCSNWQKYKLLK